MWRPPLKNLKLCGVARSVVVDRTFGGDRVGLQQEDHLASN